MSPNNFMVSVAQQINDDEKIIPSLGFHKQPVELF
jgi:hypothetical protein